MRKLALTIEELCVETFDTTASNRMPRGTVQGREEQEETYYVSCMGETCAWGGCTETDVVYACETNSCMGEMCDMSAWENQCTWGGRGGDICGSFVC
jgi:hypothetical protein